MKYGNTEINFNEATGAITEIKFIGDDMNWCGSNGEWGTVKYIVRNERRAREMQEASLVSFSKTENKIISVYENSDISITVERKFLQNGNLNEKYIIKNLKSEDMFLEKGDIQISVPFSDEYTYADDCMVHHCNTHLWCSGNIAYVNTLKMGESEINLGLFMTNGRVSNYSTDGTKGNNRGLFLLNCEHEELLSGGELVFEWQLFWHKGKDDFLKKIKEFDNYIGIEAKNHTVFLNENIEFLIDTRADNIKVSCNGKNVETVKKKEGFFVSFKPEKFGEYIFCISYNNRKTYAEFFATYDLITLISRRIDYIVDKQQYKKEESELDGAYLIYDTKENYLIFDSVIRDHNACRERIGMALLIAKYLQRNENVKFRSSLEKYIKFLTRTFFDTETGEVFDGINRANRIKRLYNAPWVVMLLSEMYILTKEKKYLTYIIRALENYYENGGAKFYPNAIEVETVIKAFRLANDVNRENRAIELFQKHADNIAEKGLSYPKHEANYEQTIVSPAVSILSGMAYITGDELYKNEAKKHIKILERFNGNQPSYHLKEIPIRYWDDFWFGKSRMYGDTFPHYWSCLSAQSYISYYNVSGEEKYKKSAEETFRNCLCLFGENGEGSAAYVYPYRVNGERGQFYDEWANDQDFALYFYLNYRFDDLNK